MKELLGNDITSTMRGFLNEDPDNCYVGNFVGIVENNNDPLKIGRCQIRINGIHDDIPSEQLQWAEPDFSLAAGIRGSFIVPEVGTTVNMYYNNGDIYQPRYFGKAIDKTTNNFTADKNEDYPDTVILYETKYGDFLKFNRLKGSFEIRTHAGVRFTFEQNGDVFLDNTSSNNGDATVNLRGDFIFDNRKGDSKIISNNISVSAFGDIETASNGTIETESLGSHTIRTNNDFEVISSDRIALKSKNNIRLESTETQIRSNTVSTAPSKIGAFKYSFCEDVSQVPTLTVVPDSTGGPFNCIMFDPLTGAPHQGRKVTGTSLLESDPADKASEIAKLTSQIESKYASLFKTATQEIERRYASLDMQAQLLSNMLGSTTLSSSKDDDITNKTAELTTQMNNELDNVNTDYNKFLTTPIFETEQTNYDSYTETLDDPTNIAIVSLDITGKTTIKDVCGSGKGLVNDE